MNAMVILKLVIIVTLLTEILIIKAIMNNT